MIRTALRTTTAAALTSIRNCSHVSKTELGEGGGGGGGDFVSVSRKQEAIRNSDEQCREAAQHGQFLLMHKGKPLMNSARKISWSGYERFKSVCHGDEDSLVFLRLHPESGRPLFACHVREEDDALEPGNGDEKFVDLRLAMFTTEDRTSVQLMTRAWSMLNWHRKTTFCANCGDKLSRSLSGSQRSCPSCESVYYPRLSPCGIVLLESHDCSKVLLIRQPVYPPGMFSCVAGFVDLGETLEDCVRREAAEEAGVEVAPGSVRIQESQHWPFPSGSLMTGCVATLTADSVPAVDSRELEEVRWFTPQELTKAFEKSLKNPKLRLAKDNPRDNWFVPPKVAIAHQLIREWLIKHGHWQDKKC